MGSTRRGRPPRTDVDRYPSGKIKPASGHREPISGALWQRMVADGEKLFRDAKFGTELTRLGVLGELEPSLVATGIRIAGIYGRYEYYQGLRRSAPSPHYIREYISEGAGDDTEANNFRFGEGRERDKSFMTASDRAEREAASIEAFKDLQKNILVHHRPILERLCVENQNVGYQGLIVARAALRTGRIYFSELDDKKRRAPSTKPKRTLKQHSNTSEAKSAAKEAFLTVQRTIAPGMTAEQLEQAWRAFVALRDRDEFRRDKARAPA